MKAGKYKKVWMCGVLALAMGAAVTFSQLKVFAGDRIDTSKKCSLTITLADDIAGQYPDLAKAEVPVTLYQVANINDDAVYEPLDGFANIGLADIDSNTTAENWAAIAEKACQAIGRPYEIKEEAQETQEPAVKNPVKKEFTVKFNGDSRTLGEIDCGLYLVYAEETQTDNYIYNFTPYLVSLPSTEYRMTGEGSDMWTYDVTMGLKPQQNIRYGELVIEKTVDTVNTSMGGATCVFQVEATKEDTVTYSNVLSLNFNEPGTKQIVVDQIPMGSEVTVTEIYAGAGYKLTSDSEVKVTVVTPETEGYPATAKFTNTYDYPGYGTSVVNHFEQIGKGWKWSGPQTDNAGSNGEE